MSPSYYVGLTLHLVLFLSLVGVCAFNDGKVAHDWTDCLIPLGLLLVPMILACAGGALRSRRFLMGASIVGCLLGVLSLTGPGLFILIPAILYGTATVAHDKEELGERPGSTGIRY